MSLPASLTMRQWETQIIESSVKTQSGALLSDGPGVGVEWTLNANGANGIVAIFGVPGSFDATLRAIGPSGPRLVTITESIFGIDPNVPGGQFNKVNKVYTITLTVTSDPLQIPDGSFVTE